VNRCSAPLDILIKGGKLLTLSPGDEIWDDPVIGIRDGRIIFIEAAHSPLTSLYAPKETIDAAGCLILPGLINTHTHVPMVCFRGLADDLPLMEWLEGYIFPAERKYVSREMVRAGALLGIAEMILSGTTTFCDGYFYESTIAGAALETGIRCVAGMGIFDSDVNNTGTAEVKSHVAAADKFLDKWAGNQPLVVPAVFCHAPYTCSPQTLHAVKETARRHNVPFLIHVAETSSENDIIRDRYHAGAVEHLAGLGVLDEKTVAIHCNWLSGDDISRLADAGVKVSHNPQSNMKLASGIGPVADLLAAGVTVGLGTDGCASNNDHDMFGEMDSAAKLQKVCQRNPAIMDAKTVLKMATSEGAKVLGLEGITGTIEVGKVADIIIVDTRKPHLTPMFNPYSQLVYAARGADVRTSIINGRIIMKDRRLLTIDLEEVMAAVESIAAVIKTDHRA